MANYYLVFQNKSYQFERDGQYLWAPKYSKLNRTISHWESMKSVKAGDVIIHSFNRHIVAISVALKDSYSSIQPDDLRQKSLWTDEGWRVDTHYYEIPHPIDVSAIISELLPIQPILNAPYNRLGRGNTGYLFNANKEILELILLKTYHNQPDHASKNIIQRIIEATHIDPVSKEQVEIEADLVLNADLFTLSSVPQVSPPTAPKPVEKVALSTTKSGIEYYPRNTQTARNALARSNYKCEIDKEHATFMRKNLNIPYTEPHHLIPLSKHEQFEKSLDVEANIVSLCSNCHNHLHYGNNILPLLKKLYDERKADLETAGLIITLDELIKFYV